MFINDINRFGNFRNTPYKMKTVHCSQFLDASEKGNQGRLNRLIESLSELNAKYDIEPFIYTVNRNPKPTIIEDYFIKLGGKNFFSYITDNDLEKVFENDYKFNSNLIQKLHDELLNGTTRFPYTIDIYIRL